MRLSTLPECSRALMHASMIACVISSTWSVGIPSSRARLPAARAAAISMSGTMGSVSSICRSAAAVMARISSGDELKGQENGGGGLDPVRDPAELVERQQRTGVGREDGWQCPARRQNGLDLGDAGLSDVVHGCPLWSDHPKSNPAATPATSLASLVTSLRREVYNK